MRNTTLGRTGMKVSHMAFGTWQLGGDWGGFAAEDASLTALGIDYIDLCQMHWPDPDVPVAEREHRLPSADRRGKSSAFRGETYRRNLAVVRELQDFASARGMTVSRPAIARTPAHPAEHVDESLAAADLSLSEEDLAGIDEIMTAATPVAGPSPEAM